MNVTVFVLKKKKKITSQIIQQIKLGIYFQYGTVLCLYAAQIFVIRLRSDRDLKIKILISEKENARKRERKRKYLQTWINICLVNIANAKELEFFCDFAIFSFHENVFFKYWWKGSVLFEETHYFKFSTLSLICTSGKISLN